MVNNKIGNLLNEIRVSRSRILAEVEKLNPIQGSTKVESIGWNIQEVIEHLVLAERGGFDLIYTASEKFRMGEPVWTGESKNEGLSIEEIISKTWRPKEKAPESATPTGKWSLGVWSSHFRNCDDLMKNLNSILEGLPLKEVIYPHFLCGPLNVIQRLEFIRFHIDRHHMQIKKIKKGIELRS